MRARVTAIRFPASQRETRLTKPESAPRKHKNSRQGASFCVPDRPRNSINFPAFLLIMSRDMVDFSASRLELAHADLAKRPLRAAGTHHVGAAFQPGSDSDPRHRLRGESAGEIFGTDPPGVKKCAPGGECSRSSRRLPLEAPADADFFERGDPHD